MSNIMLQKYTPETIKLSRLIVLFGHDTLNWSKNDKGIRVRLLREKCYITWSPKTFLLLLGSKTKAQRFHGCLEGDYEIATCGFYTNNMKGVARLFEKYGDMFDAIQTHDQYIEMKRLSNEMIKNL